MSDPALGAIGLSRALLDALNTPEWRALTEREERLVRELGDAIGYGRVMQLAERFWREKLVADGIPAGGEMTVGPRAGSLVPCPCQRRSDCTRANRCAWCCGVGRVTERVARAMQRGKRGG